MDAEYWQQRWNEGRTGWHRDEVMPLLREHWTQARVSRGSRVLVPLCGKSLDMAWLGMGGYKVLGIELAYAGIEGYLYEQGFEPPFEVEHTEAGPQYQAGPVRLLQADIFDVPRSVLGQCSGIYDRAAMIALPAQTRARYVHHVYRALPQDSGGLLITLEYPQTEKAGPPFSVSEDEVRTLLEPDWKVELVKRKDILANEPGFIAEGVSRLHTALYALRKR